MDGEDLAIDQYIEKKEKGYAYMQYIPTDYNLLDENYAYAIISYVGTPAFKNDGPQI